MVVEPRGVCMHVSRTRRSTPAESRRIELHAGVHSVSCLERVQNTPLTGFAVLPRQSVARRDDGSWKAPNPQPLRTAHSGLPVHGSRYQNHSGTKGRCRSPPPMRGSPSRCTLSGCFALQSHASRKNAKDRMQLRGVREREREREGGKGGGREGGCWSLIHSLAPDQTRASAPDRRLVICKDAVVNSRRKLSTLAPMRSCTCKRGQAPKKGLHVLSLFLAHMPGDCRVERRLPGNGSG